MARLEVPVFSATAAHRVVELGAARIELNAGGLYSAGGLTPSVEELAAVRRGLTPDRAGVPPVRVMVRPRGKRSSSEPDFV